ncbi:MAG: hypothetical protein ACHQEA_07265 [Gaiellales bacterium]
MPAGRAGAGVPAQQADAWVSAFATASKCMLDALARTPSEPVLLN